MEVSKTSKQKKLGIQKRKYVYLTIIDSIKEHNKLPTIMSRQALNRYVRNLKREGIIRKIGYSTWEIIQDLTREEINEKLVKTSRVAKLLNLKLRNDTTVSSEIFKKILKTSKIYKCIFCNEHKEIEVHHIVPIKHCGNNKISNLIPLCPTHHRSAHYGGITEYQYKKIKRFHNKLLGIKELKADLVRGHAFLFKVKIKPNLRNWSRRYEYIKTRFPKLKPRKFNNNAVGIIFKGKKIHLCSKSIVIYDKESYINQFASKSKSYAIYELIELIKSLENKFNNPGVFTINGCYKFTVCREHYALVKNSLAKQHRINGEKLKIFNTEGLWMLIDNSYNLDEWEILKNKEKDPKQAVNDSEALQSYWNDHKDTKFKVTPSFILQSLDKNSEQLNKMTYALEIVKSNQQIFDKNHESHLKVLNKLGDAVDELRKEIKRFRKPN